MGLVGGAYYQFVEIPAVQESLDAEYERYVSAFSVEEAGEAALLILGEDETVSGREIGAALATPVYGTVPGDAVVTVHHESAGPGGPTEYRVPVARRGNGIL
ncbi:MAG: hypothetical protein ACOCYQ_03380 [Alkalispirochaeta sp.]